MTTKTKKTILIVISTIIVLLLATTIYIYKTIFIQTKFDNKINIIPFSLEKKEYNTKQTAKINQFPTNYNDTIENNNLSITQNNRILLLRNGKTIVKETNKTIPEITKQALENNTPYLLTSQMITLYYLNQLENIQEEINTTYTKENLEAILKTGIDTLKILSINPSINKDALESLGIKINKAISQLDNNNTIEAINTINNMSKDEKDIFTRYNKDINKITEINEVNTIINLPLIFNDKEENYIEQEININIETISNKQDLSFTDKTIFIESDKKNYDTILQLINYQIYQLESRGIHSTNLDTIKTNFNNILTYIDKQNSDNDLDNSLIKDIINKLPITTENTNILLSTINYKGEDILTISPYIGDIEDDIDNNNFNSDYDVTPTIQKEGTIRIPVLMYHVIGDAPEGSSSFVEGLYVSEDIFRQQIAYLVKKGYRAITPKEFREIIDSGKNPTQKTIMITFDDGTPTHYDKAYPILKEYGLTGVFYIISAKGSLSNEQLKEMSDNGMVINSHSATHSSLSSSDTAFLNYEIGGSKHTLESITGKSVDSIAYPGCAYSSTAMSVTSSSGYLLGFSCGSWIDYRSGNYYSLSRIHVFNDMDDFINKLSGY